MQNKKSSAQKVWGIPDGVLLLAQHESKKFEVKHGMFAAIPIICKGEDCPYRSTCDVDPTILPIGYRCPIEMGAIMSRFEFWCKHFNVDTSSDVISDIDAVDATLIRDLVDNEIQVLRAENRIALSADFIGRTISTVDNKGTAYYTDEVTPEATFKLQLLDKRYKILQLLNSTRKDKAKESKLELSPSMQAMSIFNQVSEKMANINKGEK